MIHPRTPQNSTLNANLSTPKPYLHSARAENPCTSRSYISYPNNISTIHIHSTTYLTHTSPHTQPATPPGSFHAKCAARLRALFNTAPSSHSAVFRDQFAYSRLRRGLSLRAWDTGRLSFPDRRCSNLSLGASWLLSSVLQY